MRIQDLDPTKAAIRAVMWGFHKALRGPEELARDLVATPDVVARVLNEVLEEAASRIEREHQARMVREVGQLLIWILSRDTAYRDVRDWALREALQRLGAARLPPAREPQDWYINVYEAGVRMNRERKADGLLLPGESTDTVTLGVGDDAL